MSDGDDRGSGVVSLAARTVAPPATISAEARALYIGQLAATGTFEFPDSDDADVWRAAIAAIDGQVGERLAMFDAMPWIASRSETIQGATAYVASMDGAPEDCVYLDIHGGALVLLGGPNCERMAKAQAMMTGLVAWSVDYRMPPDYPYPAGLDDCLAVYTALVERYGADRIVVGGGSAGANLAAALLLKAKDLGLPMPAGLVLLTPEIDLTESGDTMTTLMGLDSVLTSSLMTVNRMYANGEDLAHPYLSPLFGDLAGFPPTLVQAGTRDLFLSNAARMHRALRRAGVEAELHVFEGMPHGGFAGAPEDMEMAGEVRRFVRSRLKLKD